MLGPSGCGKTTLLRMIAGFEDVTEGAIFLFGDEIENLPPNKRPVNTVFQNYALFPHMTIADNVELWPGNARQIQGSEAPANAPVRCWSLCSCRSLLPVNPHSSQVGSNSVWRWRVRWRHSPRFCCWTNRFRRWI